MIRRTATCAFLVILMTSISPAAPRQWSVGDVYELTSEKSTAGQLRAYISVDETRVEQWRVAAVSDGVARIEVEVTRHRRRHSIDNPSGGGPPGDVGHRYVIEVDAFGRVLSAKWAGAPGDAPQESLRRDKPEGWQSALVEEPPDARAGWTRNRSMPSLMGADLDVHLDFTREGERIVAVGDGQHSGSLAMALLVTLTYHQRQAVYDFDRDGQLRQSEVELHVEGTLRKPRLPEDPPETPMIEWVPVAFSFMDTTTWRKVE